MGYGIVSHTINQRLSLQELADQRGQWWRSAIVVAALVLVSNGWRRLQQCLLLYCAVGQM